MNVIVTVNGQTYSIPLQEAQAFCNRQSPQVDNYIRIGNEKVYIPKRTAQELHRQIHEKVYV